MKRVMTVFCFFLLPALSSFSAMATDIATCSSSSGYAYYALRGLNKESDTGWQEDKISEGKFTLSLDEEGNADLLVTDATGRVFSSVSEGATVVPATISEDAVTIMVLYPNALVEAYAFQKLGNGKYQAMWTQTKVETMFPKVAAYISDCSYLNLEAFKK